ncbi:MAG TPA: LysM peptidoglycan-binding domain-containing protein [Thermoanaerobaculia bacterium]|jgi:nucleoid-associated protein YgaU|nr:LysM peptidoglycan-binding domain-containing protein [Thermoanaerobaculia bacterium]
MGLFSERHDDDAEREATRRHRDAQQRLADARGRQLERQGSGLSSPSTHSGYPESSWRKEFDLYVVKKGDTLATISRQVYGDTNQWHRIQQANPIVLKNPELVHSGLVLRIPKGDGKPLA